MGINPIIFGPYIWASIHLICLGAPKTLTSEQKQQYKSFFNLLANVLPCSSCGKHLAENLRQLPVDNSLNSSADLFQWSVKLHNLVNSQLHKPQLNDMDALKFWSSAPQCSISATKGSSFSYGNLYLVIVAMVGIIIGIILNSVYLYKFVKK